jgi:pimeloyl-ACP methyl ester carboxylesterase
MSDAPRQLAIALPERGVTLAVYDWEGPGPLLLCTHATGFCGRLWELLAHELRGAFRVLAYDVRGHGDSSAPPPPDAYEWEGLALDLIALADALCAELGAARIDYAIGNSMGGAVTLVAASRRPERFGRIALVDPVILLPEQRTGIPGSNARADGARKRRALWPSRSAVREAYAARPLFADWRPRALELYVEHGFRERAGGQVELKCAPEVEGALFALAPRLDLFADAPALRVPGALMRAQRGDFSPESAQRLAAAAPSLELWPIDTAHLAPMTEPALLGAQLRAYYAADSTSR